MEYKSRIAILEKVEQRNEGEIYNIIEQLNNRTRAALYSEKRKMQMD
jgi:hypothetical protein